MATTPTGRCGDGERDVPAWLALGYWTIVPALTLGALAGWLRDPVSWYGIETLRAGALLMLLRWTLDSERL